MIGRDFGKCHVGQKQFRECNKCSRLTKLNDSSYISNAVFFLDESAGAAPSGEIDGKSRTVLLEMLTDDGDETTTDIEYVTTPRTDEETDEPKQPEVHEPEMLEPDLGDASGEKKDAAVDGATKDLLNESFEAIISIHR